MASLLLHNAVKAGREGERKREQEYGKDGKGKGLKVKVKGQTPGLKSYIQPPACAEVSRVVNIQACSGCFLQLVQKSLFLTSMLKVDRAGHISD